MWIPKKFEENISSDHFKRKNDKINYFSSSQLAEVIAENWGKYSGHIFVMASGIVIRKICKLVDSKLTDPAVVCCDEKGNNVISLLSGHIGGANRLAKVVAGITMGNVAITTATDVNNLIAFDEMAKLENYSMLNPKSIKILNMLLLENRKIGVVLPIKIFEKYYQGCSNIELIESASSKQLNDLINEKYFDGLVVLKNVSGKNFSCNQENILWLESKH
ncbi:hypothetical protein LJT99_04115 [Lentisphaerae bacterium WC36]|nr:hypothetical protein LJT99_04115 [Lentisphaerae bacterium WC36]